MLRSMLGVLAVAALALAATPARAAGPAAGDADLRRDLEALARRAILFGHQSVGMNLLDGLKRLAAGTGVPLRIQDVSATGTVPPATFAHAFIPENGDPGRKLESYQKALAATAPGSVDLALMKFCYIDFSRDTDAKALFARYQAAVEGYRKAQPGAVLVHVTVPLTTIAGGWKTMVKRLLGTPPWGVLENARRDEFNELLRAAYQGKDPVFDLALVESTRPDGTRETYAHGGKIYPALVEAYTDDGGHLDAAGQDRAARALVSVLAKAAAGLPARSPP